ncbi:hypothetical protein ACN28I_06900 [Archangium gephyra]|uniref:hypothetical protein n=1 Tax=Archangium gephyra TaxID=48 RepID=UPI003B804040
MALLLEPSARLVFVTDPEDTGCQEKLALYRGLGVARDQLTALVVCKADESEMPAPTLAELKKLARVRVIAVGTGRDPQKPNKRSYDANQVCKWLVNADIFEREGEKAPEGREGRIAQLRTWYRAVDLPYLNHKERANITEVGASTRIVAEKIQQDRLPAVLKKTWASVSSSSWNADASQHAAAAAERLFRSLQKQSPQGVLLVWVRGLSGDERDKLKTLQGTTGKTLLQRRDQGEDVEDLFSPLDKKKRNPHHLMTPQLFETVRYVGQRMKFAVLPIGDELLFDEYQAVSRGKAAQAYQGGSADNLIGFWSRDKWFGGPERRFRQLLLLWHLFRRLSTWNIPLVQVGLRSGEMEKAAYLGVPTIYIEEKASETGARMLPVTVGGSFPKSKEPATDAKAWWGDRNTVVRGGTSDPNLLQKKVEEAKRILGYKDKKKKEEWDKYSKNVETAQSNLKDAQDKVRSLDERHEAMSSQQLDAFLFATTDHSALQGALDGGYPFFFRLLTQNLVGLYGAGTQGQVDQVTRWLETTFSRTSDPAPCDAQLLRGTLAEFEIDLLYNMLCGIQAQFRAYKRKFLPAEYLR